MLYRISYMWYTLIGALVCIVCAQVSSMFWGRNDIYSIPTELLAPFIRKLLKNQRVTNQDYLDATITLNDKTVESKF